MRDGAVMATLEMPPNGFLTRIVLQQLDSEYEFVADMELIPLKYFWLLFNSINVIFLFSIGKI